MFETLLKYFQDSPFSLWGPFLVLLLCGLGLPLPEDVVLISAGALGEIDGRSWLEVSAVMYAGVMLGDSMLFFAGRFFGGRLRSAVWFQRAFSPKKQTKVEDLFERYQSWVLFVGRFLPGLRAPIFFTAGSTRVKFWKFFFFDGLAALISVPFFVWLGHWLWEKFKDDLVALEEALARTQTFTMITVTVIFLLVVAVGVKKFRQLKMKWDE
jgi:membrane protein DedA with SNARE-associated domain